MSRYSLILDADDLILDADGNADTALLGGTSLEAIPAPYRRPRYNISRGQCIIVLRSNTETGPDNLIASTMQWGFT
ncbi:MAG TPA: hypothetical protein VLC91_11040, partial [Spongiibacteraceae bacterium]|nr:hypothetical protein [Spongiibacteraceae bacterium]